MIPPDEWDRYRALFGCPDLLARLKTAEQYANRLLPFIPRGLPVYQSHGINHSLALIRNINQIFRSPVLQVHPQEIFLLYLAAWFHDLGYLHPLSIHNRRTHPVISVEMIRKDTIIRGLVRDEEMPILESIIRYHESHTDLMMIQETMPSLRTPLLAALFRIVDAVDIGTDRCPPEVYSLIEDGLDEHSQKHWQAHQNIQECVIVYPVIRIQVHDPEDQIFLTRIIPHLENDCQSTGVIFEQYGMAPMVLAYQRSDQIVNQLILL
jgi:hypothetical protein